MPVTRPISKIVGPRLKTIALRMKEMPRVPRSMALDSAPVWRLRWNPRSRLCKWRKTFLAMRRMELWATLPNTVFLSSLKRAAQARDTPSGRAEETESLARQLWKAALLGAIWWKCIPHPKPPWLLWSSKIRIWPKSSLSWKIVTQNIEIVKTGTGWGMSHALR